MHGKYEIGLNLTLKTLHLNSKYKIPHNTTYTNKSHSTVLPLSYSQ